MLVRRATASPLSRGTVPPVHPYLSTPTVPPVHPCPALPYPTLPPSLPNTYPPPTPPLAPRAPVSNQPPHTPPQLPLKIQKSMLLRYSRSRGLSVLFRRAVGAFCRAGGASSPPAPAAAAAARRVTEAERCRGTNEGTKSSTRGLRWPRI